VSNSFDIPPDLHGRRERDPFLVAVTRFFTGVERVRSLRRARVPRPPRPLSRELILLVREVRREADDVVSVRLAAWNGAPLPEWQPGCHLDVRLPSGRRRQYSLCGDPADRTSYRIAVRRLPDGEGGSLEVHEALTEGRVVKVQGPRNAFPFLPNERYLFLAGGIGITPILPMVKEAQRVGADWRLIYTGRDLASLAFLNELESLPEGRVTVRTDDEHGVPDCADLLAGAPADAAIYCCGPAPMIDGVRAAFRARGTGTLHFERFAPAPVVGGQPFEVALARSGKTVAVPADRSALEAVKAELPDVAYSCRQGFCGTCRVGVLSGEVDRRAASDRADEGSMLICVSRASGGRITLDL
jgi:ferredoxin-NADP reductase